MAESLQWGRDRMIAETWVYDLKRYLYFELQWGRDRMIAETSKAGASKSLCKRFNGAATG